MCSSQATNIASAYYDDLINWLKIKLRHFLTAILLFVVNNVHTQIETSFLITNLLFFFSDNLYFLLIINIKLSQNKYQFEQTV